jgi:hypothetical protein
MKHHEYSPSKLNLLKACEKFESQPPDASRHTALSRGTTMHEALAEMLKGKTSPLEGADAEGVQWACDFILSRHRPEELKIETKLQLLDDDMNEVTAGTPDVFVAPQIAGGRAFLYDLKSGESHDYGIQMRSYASMAGYVTGAEIVEITILYADKKFASTYQVSANSAREEVLALIAKLKRKEGKETPNDFCGWCARASVCPALNERALAIARGREDWVLENYHPSQISTATEMGKALRLAKLIEKWCESVQFHATKLAESGLIPDGFEYSTRSGSRYVANIQLAFERSGLTPEEFMPLCSVGVGGLSEAIAKRTGVSPATANKKLTAILGDALAQKPETKTLRAIKKKEIE